MIKIVEGNILDATEDMICQQVNCKNVMNSGLAKQIKENYPEVEKAYHEVCDTKKPKDLLGLAQIVYCLDGKHVVNIFGQLNYGRGKLQTDYKALGAGLDSVFLSVTSGKHKGQSVAVPYGIGCGLGGGDWDIVYRLIKLVSDYYGCDVTIYQLNEQEQ